MPRIGSTMLRFGIKPSFVKGLSVGAELQHVGSYYVDPLNTAKYDGYNVLNLRAGYQVQRSGSLVECFQCN